MCTAVIYKNRYFGRNLDYDYSYGETVVTTPAGFSILPQGKEKTRYAIMGMAHVAEGYPLYYDGMNEKGLAMAGLLFAGNCVYHPSVAGKENIPSWAFIPWILGQCETAAEAEGYLKRLNLTDEAFSKDLPPSPLHWMIADRKKCIVVESTSDGLHIYENPVGILTNNPPFPFQLENLNQYLNLTAEEAVNRFSEKLELHPFSRGMGAIGLPGDWSSSSRFVRAAFVRNHAFSEEKNDVSQFFHILASVEQPMGCVLVEGGGWEHTIYASCCDLERGIYLYKTYHDDHVWKTSFSDKNMWKKRGFLHENASIPVD